MIKIVPDKEGRLTQWDLNRKVIVTGYEGIAEVHFASPGDDHGAYVVKLIDGEAEIPNILLTMAGTINVYLYPDDRTVFATALWVTAREKPDDYVYTETEVWRYEKFVEQLNGKEDTANRVTTVDDSSDDKHYPTAKAVYKAIPKSLKNPNSLTFTGAVTGSYDGSKPMTFNIPSGGSGTDISLGLTGAAVGDIVKVKAVDASGKPTEWEAAGYTLLSESTGISEAVAMFEFTGLTGYNDFVLVANMPRADDSARYFLDINNRRVSGRLGNYFLHPNSPKNVILGVACNLIDKHYMTYGVSQTQNSSANQDNFGVNFGQTLLGDNELIESLKITSDNSNALIPAQTSYKFYGRYINA